MIGADRIAAQSIAGGPASRRLALQVGLGDYARASVLASDREASATLSVIASDRAASVVASDRLTTEVDA